MMPAYPRCPRRVYLVTYKAVAIDGESPELVSLLWFDDSGLSQLALEDLPAGASITDISDRPIVPGLTI